MRASRGSACDQPTLRPSRVRQRARRPRCGPIRRFQRDRLKRPRGVSAIAEKYQPTILVSSRLSSRYPQIRSPMSRMSSREEALFADALAQPPAERAAFLAKACGADVNLLSHLAALIVAHEGSD